MENEIFYESISKIIQRVSNRTLEMKKNNVKLLNKISLEMSDIMFKMEELVKTYQVERNGSIF